MLELIERVGEKNENLASFFYAILLSTNTVMLILPLKIVFQKDFQDPPLIGYTVKVFLASIFFIWYYMCKRYFLDKGNCSAIIKRYSNNSKMKMSIIGGIYSAGTFILFISVAMILSKIDFVNH
jgi:hypothetical protein